MGIVDTDSLTVFLPRVVAFSPVVVGDSDVRELALGESITFQVLMAPLPPTTETVLLRGGGLRRSFPVTVGDDDGPPAVAIAEGTPPDDINEPDIFALDVPTDRFTTAMVATEAPDEPSVDELGPELPELPIVTSVTSEPQPGWTVAVRGVVRGTGGHSTLVMDLTRTDEAEDRWPESLTDGANNLAALRVIDPDARRSYGPLTDGSATVGSSDAVSFDDGSRTRTVFAALPDLGDASSVTVDLPPASVRWRTSRWSTGPTPPTARSVPPCASRTTRPSAWTSSTWAACPTAGAPWSAPGCERGEPGDRRHAPRRQPIRHL